MKTSSMVLRLTIILFVFFFCSPHNQGVCAEPAIHPKTWDGDAGDGLWSNRLNWSDDELPSSKDIIVIRNVSGEIHLGDFDFKSFTIEGTLQVVGASPSFATTLVIDGDFTLTNAGSILLQGAGASLINEGVIETTLKGRILLQGNATFVNNYTVTNSGTIQNQGTFNNSAIVTNNGRILNQGTFDNFGTLDNTAGFLDNQGRFISECDSTLSGGIITGNPPQDVCEGDNTPPQITVPENITAEATSPSGASVFFSASAVDDIDGPVTPSCSPLSGATFELGDTTATCLAVDEAGNVGGASFTVSVVDSTPPKVIAALDPVDAGDESRFRVRFSASDIVDPTPAVEAVLKVGSSRILSVSDGQVIALELEDDDLEIEQKGGLLDIEASSLTLRVNATDFSGNTAVVIALPVGPASTIDE